MGDNQKHIAAQAHCFTCPCCQCILLIRASCHALPYACSRASVKMLRTRANQLACPMPLSLIEREIMPRTSVMLIPSDCSRPYVKMLHTRPKSNCIFGVSEIMEIEKMLVLCMIAPATYSSCVLNAYPLSSLLFSSSLSISL